MQKENATGGDVSGAKYWLEGIGLGQYADLFARNRVDLDVLPDLTEADLAELGLPLGDRKRLLRAMAPIAKAVAADRLPGTHPTARDPRRAATAAERRQLTVMFCDMVGSTALSEQFDPEDLRDMISNYREMCARVVERYEGYVARYSGDGILVYFGYPTAHEDDAERAVRTGLEIVNTSLQSMGNAPAVRIGVATGIVVIGDLIGESTEEHDSAVGETPNLAARLQALAPPNCVVIASSTMSLLKTKFECEDLGSRVIKGLSTPVQAWRVVRPYRVESRFAAAASKLTPLVDREEEIALLLMRWQQAKESDGQVVLLSGEPGIGKSRIIQEFRDRLASEPHGQISFQCSPYYTSTAFYPFVAQLESMLRSGHDDSSQLSLTNLEASLAIPTDKLESVVPLFAALLSIEVADRYKPLDLSPQRQKDDTIAVLAAHFIESARNEPMLMILEDAHWIDPTSHEVLDQLVDLVQNASILMIVSCRPEFQPSWNAHSHITTLTLNRLSRQLRAALIERVAGTKLLPEEVIEQITVKTDGVPLFVEELTKAVIESNLVSEKDDRYVFSNPLFQLAIPATLNDSLMARLDRMGSFKKVAQIGATIGREFSYQLLRAVADMSAENLDSALRHIESAGLIIRRGHPPEATYGFKHALMQEAAHSSLLNSDRKRLHAKIAAVLLEMYPERAEREPEVFAHHFTGAGQTESAVDFWVKAGKRAAKSGANLEAIDHLRRGLGVLQGDPNVPDRDRVELALRIELGITLISAKGYAVREVEANYRRALELGQRLDDKQRIFAATRGLWVCYFIRASLVKAHALGGQLLKLARRTRRSETVDQSRQRTGQLIEAHRALGMTMLYAGRFVESRNHLERAINLYDRNLHGYLIETHGIDPEIVSLSYLGFVSWFLGRPDEAQKYSEHAILIAEKLQHPFTLAFALAFSAYVCQHLRDAQRTKEYCNRTIALSAEHGFVHWKHQATMLRGWALTELGRIDEGLNEIRAGLDGYEAMESWLASSWFRTLLVNGYQKAGRPEAALRAVDDAFVISQRTGERFFVAEIHRLQGEITLMHRPEAVSEVEACYNRSLEVCRRQKALSWELRTVISLARLWRDQGRRQHAADLLGAICDKFEHGLDTLDLKDAIQAMRELVPL